MQDNLEENKKNAIAFYRTAYFGDPAKAVNMYVGSGYIQHNPPLNGLFRVHNDWHPKLPFAPNLCILD